MMIELIIYCGFTITVLLLFKKIVQQWRIMFLMKHVIEYERQCYDMVSGGYPKPPINGLVIESYTQFTQHEYDSSMWPN